jgi:hypothetical protein
VEKHGKVGTYVDFKQHFALQWVQAYIGLFGGNIVSSPSLLQGPPKKSHAIMESLFA